MSLLWLAKPDFKDSSDKNNKWGHQLQPVQSLPVDCDIKHWEQTEHDNFTKVHEDSTNGGICGAVKIKRPQNRLIWFMSTLSAVAHTNDIRNSLCTLEDKQSKKGVHTIYSRYKHSM